MCWAKFSVWSAVAWALTTTVPGQEALPPLNILQPSNAVPPTVLAWDAVGKDHVAQPGQTHAFFTFWVTNVSTADVFVERIETTCGCAVARLPSQPWHLPPGGSGPIHVTVDLRGRWGLVLKGINVHTSAGIKVLTVRVRVPEPEARTESARPSTVPRPALSNFDDRARNLQVALGDRQAVFKGSCAGCHAEPARGRSGRALYAAVCAICHEAEPRAAMVPDLREPKPARPAAEWRKLIAEGRPGTLMPAFARAEGGPLTEAQIVSLVEALDRELPQTSAAAKPSAPAPSASRSGPLHPRERGFMAPSRRTH